MRFLSTSHEYWAFSLPTSCPSVLVTSRRHPLSWKIISIPIFWEPSLLIHFESSVIPCLSPAHFAKFLTILNHSIMIFPYLESKMYCPQPPFNHFSFSLTSYEQRLLPLKSLASHFFHNYSHSAHICPSRCSSSGHGVFHPLHGLPQSSRVHGFWHPSSTDEYLILCHYCHLML